MRMKNIIISILTTTLISACSSEQRIDRVVVDSTAVQKTPLALRDPEPLKLREVRFVVLTPENQGEIFRKMDTPVMIGLSPQGYEDVSRNLLELRGYIIELREVLRSYREYYETPGETENKK